MMKISYKGYLRSTNNKIDDVVAIRHEAQPPVHHHHHHHHVSGVVALSTDKDHQQCPMRRQQSLESTSTCRIHVLRFVL